MSYLPEEMDAEFDNWPELSMINAMEVKLMYALTADLKWPYPAITVSQPFGIPLER